MYRFVHDKYNRNDTISVAISFSRGYSEKFQEAVIDCILKFKNRTRYKVSVFIDRDNIAGNKIDDSILSHFKSADIIICLVSNSFINNRYINGYERPIIEAFDKDPFKRVIPIVVTRTKNYGRTWIGKLRLSSAPDIEALKKPYSSYDNPKYAYNIVQRELDRAFEKFHKDVVEPRIHSPRNRNVNRGIGIQHVLYFIIFVLSIVICVLYYRYVQLENSIKREEIALIRKHKLELEIFQRENTQLKYELDQLRNRDDTKRGGDVNVSGNLIQNSCNSMSSQDETFPRLLSEYSYYRSEDNFSFESCQGVNKEGWKPCKRNRQWYMVNVQQNKVVRLNMSEADHKEIYAIRPILNDVAEVYYHNGIDMYLSHCISINTGNNYP